ncbi:MAG: hypothetical protein ABL971_05325 [Vicinamibacterales bacterium]
MLQFPRWNAVRVVCWLGLAVLCPLTAGAEDGDLGEDWRQEKATLAEHCGKPELDALRTCLGTLTSGVPVRLLLGGLPPQSGLSAGLELAERHPMGRSGQLAWEAGAVVSHRGSWRTGAALSMRPGTSGPHVDVFASTTTARRLNFFGSGPEATRDGRTRFGERQAMAGGAATWPIGGPRWLAALKPEVSGGVTGRWVRVLRDDAAPGFAGDVYGEAEAPGITRRLGRFLEVRETVRVAPILSGGRASLDYRVSWQQFHDRDKAGFSFRRWTVDLAQTVALGAPGIGGQPARRLAGLRLLMRSAATDERQRVPFYLQPTMGGSDLDGDRLSAGFQDYRFRAPHLALVQARVEHALAGPVRLLLEGEWGQVAERRNALSLRDFERNVTVGIVVRGEGYPQINLLLAWSREGRHTILSMAPQAGDTWRPRLF